jgi:alcohol dehydrogenase class IV
MMPGVTFRHIAAPLRLFSGPDSLGLLGAELDRVKARRAMIVCGASIARAGGLVDLVREALGERCVGVFAGVRGHSPLPAVEAAAAALRQAEADAVIPIGGGSAVVTARAASILLAEGGDAAALSTSRDAEGRMRSPKLSAPKIPQFVVPTTPTTALMKAGSAIFDPASGRRLAMFDPKTRPQAVFVHPAMMESAPEALVTNAALNAYALAVEGLLSATSDPLADAMLLHALRLLARHMPLGGEGRDAAARAELTIAAILCGLGTDFTGAGITTVLAHAVAARFEVDNGIAKGILLPHALRFNAEAAGLGLRKLAEGLPGGEEPPLAAALKAVEALQAGLGVPRRLRDADVPREALPGIAEAGLSDWFLRSNPRKVTHASELLEVLEAAW